MMEFCQSVLDLKEMLDEWQTNVLVPSFKKKGNVRNCNLYSEVKLLEHAMKIVERIQESANDDATQRVSCKTEKRQMHCLL